MEQKSWMTALLISFFVGGLGVDRLYLGYSNWWIKLITAGGFGIWTLYDFIMILMDKMPDGNGQPLKR